jgi:hypothetical protein
MFQRRNGAGTEARTLRKRILREPSGRAEVKEH